LLETPRLGFETRLAPARRARHGGCRWRALARDVEVGDGDSRDSRSRLASEHATAPGSDDALSPGNVIRRRAAESRTERIGDGTPTGPFTSPPVEREKI